MVLVDEMNNSPTCLTSVNRIFKLPVVESTVHVATNIYDKVKKYNCLIQWSCNTAETIVTKAITVSLPIAAPIVNNFEKPIKTVDNILCSGIDYFEVKVPSIKLPPGEVVVASKDYVDHTVSPAIDTAFVYFQPVLKTVQPIVVTAKYFVDPIVGKVLIIAEPLLKPVIERARIIVEPIVANIKECTQRKCSQGHTEENADCESCASLKQPPHPDDDNDNVSESADNNY